jgi:hypothetical protein
LKNLLLCPEISRFIILAARKTAKTKTYENPKNKTTTAAILHHVSSSAIQSNFHGFTTVLGTFIHRWKDRKFVNLSD